MRISRVALLAALLCTSILSSCSNSSKDKKEAAAKPVLTTEESALVTVKATVQAIDQRTRQMTLRTEHGDTVTFTVDKRVKRLNEVHVGDVVAANYYISIAGELRAPTAEEEKNPAVVVAGQAKAPQGTEPAAGALRVFRLVTTVQAIDLANQTVTLRGPLGNDVTIRARKPENLKLMRVGDTIVVTYTEALAISLEKVAS